MPIGIATDYFFADYGVDSSRRFHFRLRARTDRQTDRQTDKVTDATESTMHGPRPRLPAWGKDVSKSY